jgi:DNA-binding Lrp family transcriptional regulator
MARLISHNDLKAKGIPYSKVHLWRLEKQNRFPKRVPIGSGPLRVRRSRGRRIHRGLHRGARPEQPVPPVKTSDDLILITKKVRMEWTDMMALDPELSPKAFKIAGVIASHFNNYSGEAYVTQERIARVVGLSRRTVQNAILELEKLGYLIVGRRELGIRSDGRRVCGGRGVANTYTPAFKRTQVPATDAARKLAARCVLSWEQRTQNAARKDAAGYVPTLIDNSLTSHSLGAEGLLLLARLGRAVFALGFEMFRSKW